MFDDNPTILRGVPQVLSAVSMIDDLRRRVEQDQDLSTDLFLILSRHDSRKRRPVLVLLCKQAHPAAAVLFAERCILGVGLGLLRAGDQVGDGAVIAHREDREAALLAASRALLSQWRCHTVAATLGTLTERAIVDTGNKALLFEASFRTVHRYLPLSASLETTLRERFTTKKRRNLLYYHRRLSKRYDVDFVPEIGLSEVEQAMLELAHHSWPLRTPNEIADHCRFLRRHPQCFCMGLRLKTGRWLSLITGWRTNGVTHMPWQMNHESYKDESLMQVMRTRLLNHECLYGQRALNWVGGTVAFQTACEPEICRDLLVARRGLRHRLLRRVLVPMLFRRKPEAFTGGSLMLLLNPRLRGTPDLRLSPDS